MMRVSTLIFCWGLVFISAYAFAMLCLHVPAPWGGLLGVLLIIATEKTLGVIMRLK
jgi:hypothetical protein